MVIHIRRAFTVKAVLNALTPVKLNPASYHRNSNIPTLATKLFTEEDEIPKGFLRNYTKSYNYLIEDQL